MRNVENVFSKQTSEEEEKPTISVERRLVKPGAGNEGVLSVSVSIGHTASLSEVQKSKISAERVPPAPAYREPEPWDCS